MAIGYCVGQHSSEEFREKSFSFICKMGIKIGPICLIWLSEANKMMNVKKFYSRKGSGKIDSSVNL